MNKAQKEYAEVKLVLAIRKNRLLMSRYLKPRRQSACSAFDWRGRENRYNRTGDKSMAIYAEYLDFDTEEDKLKQQQLYQQPAVGANGSGGQKDQPSAKLAACRCAILP